MDHHISWFCFVRTETVGSWSTKFVLAVVPGKTEIIHDSLINWELHRTFQVFHFLQLLVFTIKGKRHNLKYRNVWRSNQWTSLFKLHKMSTTYKNRSSELNKCQCISFTEQMFQLTLSTPKYGASGKYVIWDYIPLMLISSCNIINKNLTSIFSTELIPTLSLKQIKRICSTLINRKEFPT